MDPPLDNARHLRYWQRCLRTLLPHQYTGNDSTRMTLGCFAVAAVDVLSTASSSSSSSPPTIPPADRRKFREWVLACQHPGGGFAGGPTHVYPRPVYSGFDFAAGRPATGAPGEANIAATLFALQLLALLADGGEGDGGGSSGGVAPSSAFLGVDRNATLGWLRQLQREDGSFGEFVAEVADASAPGGRRLLIAGGSDMRYCYIASMIRWMLRGDVQEGSPAWVDDIDVDALVLYMRRGQTYDGGFAESSTHESHAGYAFCAIAALSLLERPPEGSASVNKESLLSRGIADLPALIRWLGSRSFLFKPASEEDEEDEEEEEEEWHESIVTDVTPEALLLPDCHPLLGFNGRCNKHADSCYTWWTVGAMAILARHGLVEESQIIWEPSRRFLIEETQHLIGGFSKTARGPPDVYHSYLGLAALATRHEPSLKAFDPAMSVSLDTVKTIEAARRGLLRGLGEGGWARKDALLKMGRSCWTGPSEKAVAAQ